MGTKIMLCPKCHNGFLLRQSSKTMFHRIMRIIRENSVVFCTHCKSFSRYEDFKPVDKITE